MRLLEKFSAAIGNIFKPAEFPQTMKSMAFDQPHDIPYTGTEYGYSDFFYTYTYKEPKKISGTKHSHKYTWHEARRVSDKDGFKYTIHTMEVINPTLHGGTKTTDTQLVFEHKNPLVTKTEALLQLEHLEQVSLRDMDKKINQDARQTKGHYSRYIPVAAPAKAAPSAKPKI
jgi:hypothetical protein